MSIEVNKTNSRKKKPFTQKKAKRIETNASIEAVKKKCVDLEKVNTTTLKLFSDIPLSSETLKGLKECDYIHPTEIQRDSLPFSLTGYDVVGAAKTGSGKTLALVIPLLECLWKARWQKTHGLGALIISPTRELALQTFTCINHVGKHHNFSCALLIGGTDVAYERNRLGAVNIIVCTPGRLLQHMDENEHLISDQLQILVIDEADRILDMGFKKQINAIVANLPEERQTLLFSATQTKNIKDLTRVCTKDPVFVSVHENSTSATPDQLQQSYLVCEEQDKLNILWSFIKKHIKTKLLVFVSSCRQARFITDAFCHLRPGLPVMGLWGGMNQTKRVQFFEKFENSQRAVMIATDVASRGLDFSDINWVIQMDAPATVEDYIHRVGRTARMNRKGHALMFLTPFQEKGAIHMLKAKNIEINLLSVDPQALKDIRDKLRSLLAHFGELNQFAQKSLAAYLRSVYLMKEKSIFNVESIDAAALADSYGLVSVPRVRFLSKKGIQVKENIKDEEPEKKPKTVSLVGKFAADDEIDNLFTVKKSDVFNVLPENNELLASIEETKAEKKMKKIVTKEKVAKKILNKGIIVNKKVIFDDEGEIEKVIGVADSSRVNGLNILEAKEELKSASKEDRIRLKELKKRMKKNKSTKLNQNEVIDMADDGGESDVDLDWLPDPDEVKKRYLDEDNYEDDIEIAKPSKKKRKANSNILKAEKEALALLDPL